MDSSPETSASLIACLDRFHLLSISPSTMCTIFFSALTGVLLLVLVILPQDVQTKLLEYGARMTGETGETGDTSNQDADLKGGEGTGYGCSNSTDHQHQEHQQEDTATVKKRIPGHKEGLLTEEEKEKEKKEKREKEWNRGLRSPVNPKEKPHVLLSFLSTFTPFILRPIPHSYFTHFYIFLLASQLFWAHQYLKRGSIIISLSRWEIHAVEGETTGSPCTLPLERVFLGWAMLTIQAIRRIVDCVFIMKLSSGSKSKILLGHYIMTLGFYAVMSVSVWVMGAGMFAASSCPG